MVEIRNRIHVELLRLNVTEVEFARMVGMDQGHLNRVKNRRLRPTLLTALKIASALGKPVDKVFWIDAKDAPGLRIARKASALADEVIP